MAPNEDSMIITDETELRELADLASGTCLKLGSSVRALLDRVEELERDRTAYQDLFSSTVDAGNLQQNELEACRKENALLRDQLEALTLARNEACAMATRAIDAIDALHAEHLSQERLKELRAVGGDGT